MKYREYRILANLTLQELADKLGCSKAYVSQVETFKREPSIRNVIHAAAILNTCVCKLLDCPCDVCNPHFSDDIDFYAI